MNTVLRHSAAFTFCIGGATLANMYPSMGWMFGWWGCMATVLVMGGKLQGE